MRAIQHYLQTVPVARSSAGEISGHIQVLKRPPPCTRCQDLPHRKDGSTGDVNFSRWFDMCVFSKISRRHLLLSSRRPVNKTDSHNFLGTARCIPMHTSRGQADDEAAVCVAASRFVLPVGKKRPSRRTPHLLGGFWLQISLRLDGVGRRPVFDFCFLVLFLGVPLLNMRKHADKPGEEGNTHLNQRI